MCRRGCGDDGVGGGGGGSGNSPLLLCRPDHPGHPGHPLLLQLLQEHKVTSPLYSITPSTHHPITSFLMATRDPKPATTERSEGEGNGGEERSEGEGNGALSGGKERSQGTRDETYLTDSFPMRNALSTGITMEALETRGGLSRTAGAEGLLRTPLTWVGRSPKS